MPDWPNPEETNSTIATLTEQLDQERNYTEILTESMASLELAAEDIGWVKLGIETDRAMSRSGLAQIVTNCRVMAIASPLIKRGLLLRRAYVWGQGLGITARDEDINAVIQGFLDDESNVQSFTSSQAREELEQALGTDGNLFLAAFTNPLFGRVQVRSTPFDEIRDVVTNPEDRDEPWLYLREYQATVIEAGTMPGTTRSRQETRRVYHPALGWWPQQRVQAVDGIPVRWDAPILHISVNRLDGAKWGVPDSYAAITWARAYEGFLTDWARLMRALSKFAWRLSGDKSSKARVAAEKIQAAVRNANEVPPTRSAQPGYQPGPVGGVAASGPGMSLEAIPKSGATIDADSGRPLGAMVAAALGLPVTMLLADPGVTGARATAETLDNPTILEMGLRRTLWQSAHDRILQHVLLQAVKAPRGPLTGTISRDEAGRETFTIGDVDTTIDFDWPEIDGTDVKSLVDAIARADETEKMPPLTTMKLLLQAFGVEDIDELIEDFTDEDGNWIDPKVTAGDAAAAAFARGEDPAAVVR